VAGAGGEAMTIEEMRTIDSVKTWKELEDAKERIKRLEEFISRFCDPEDLVKQGVETCKRKGIEKPQDYIAMVIGLCDIINELKAKETNE
jgi:hypothetical protein